MQGAWVVGEAITRTAVEAQGKMNQSNAPKQGKVRPLRVLCIARTPDEIMEQELAAGFYRIHVPDGHARPRRFYKACNGELFPLRLVSRLTDDAVRCECDEQELLDAIRGPIERMIRAKYGKRRGRARVERRNDAA